MQVATLRFAARWLVRRAQLACVAHMAFFAAAFSGIFLPRSILSAFYFRSACFDSDRRLDWRVVAGCP
jgi:hypothetical protein